MKLVVGNQKTYMNKEDVLTFISETSINDNKDKNIIVCPSSLFIALYDNSNLITGLQNVSTTKNGATTGEISASQINSLGIKYCIVGHSERRELFSETGEDTNKKINMLLEHNIIPILCIGETKEQRDNNKVKEILTKEIDEAFINLDEASIEKIIIAYEPIWSIGTGLIPTMNEIKEIIEFIKKYIKDEYNGELSVLYGGSVNAKNVDELNKVDVIDGYLIGGASSKASEFNYIISSVK